MINTPKMKCWYIYKTMRKYIGKKSRSRSLVQKKIDTDGKALSQGIHVRNMKTLPLTVQFFSKCRSTVKVTKVKVKKFGTDKKAMSQGITHMKYKYPTFSGAKVIIGVKFFKM